MTTLPSLLGRRGQRIVATVGGGAAAAAVVTTVGGGILYAGQLLPAPARDRTLDITAEVTSHGTVLLPRDRRAYAQRFGLLLGDDVFLVYGGPVVNHDTAGTAGRPAVERTIVGVVRGSPTVGIAVPARFDEYVFCADPAELGIPFREVDVTLGTGQAAPAWLVEGGSDWVIAVHGRSGSRAEALRVLPTLSDAGYSVLAITYRNDQVGGPDTADGVGRFGHSEWADVSAGVQLARHHGARRIVLLGYSQGASLIAYYLRNTACPADDTAREPDAIHGVIFDSPLLSLGSTLTQQAIRRAIPSALIPLVLCGTRMVVGLRAGLDVRDVEHVPFLATTTMPLLLIHGPQDDYVPIGPSDLLAASRPSGLIYERMTGAGHVEGWNTDPERYSMLIRRFLAQVFEK